MSNGTFVFVCTDLDNHFHDGDAVNQSRFGILSDAGSATVDRLGVDSDTKHSTKVTLTTILDAPAKYLQGLRLTSDPRVPLFPMGNVSAQTLTTAAIATILEDARQNSVCIGRNDIPRVKEILTEKGVKSSDVTAVGITTTFLYNTQRVTEIVEAVRAELPNSPVVLGGAGITLNPGWFSRSGADFAIRADAEVALPALLRCLDQGRDVDDVPNLMWRNSQGLPVSNQTDPNFNLKDAPTPRWNLVGARQWPDLIFYESQRGCPFSCKFCSYPNQSEKWRYKSAEQLLREFQYYQEQGVQNIACLDSTMLSPISRMRKFAKLLIKEKSTVLWSCFAHPAQLQNAELVHMLYEAGCRRMSIGLESGSTIVLDAMAKCSTREKMFVAVQNVHEAGIYASGNFFVGFPGETRETAEETLSFVLEAKIDSCNIQVFQVRDETIPILNEAEVYNLEFRRDRDGRIHGWKHKGMSSEEATDIVSEWEAHVSSRKPSTINFMVAASLGVSGSLLYDRRINRVLKEAERAFSFHPETAFGGATAKKSLDTYEYHAKNARELLRSEISQGLWTPLKETGNGTPHIDMAAPKGDLWR